MAKLSPQEVAALWQQRMAGAGDKYKQGVSKVQENPAQSAIAAQDRLLANFTDSVTNGKWANSLSKVTLQQWRQACVEKGAAALAASARLGAEKVLRAEQEMAPIRDAIRSSLPERGTIEQNLERARMMALRMHEARKKG